MANVGILTYHTGYNYGASLQAWALQQTVLEMGHDCQILHYEPEDFHSRREMFSRDPRRLKEVLKILTRLPYYPQLTQRQAKFDRFTEECLLLSPLCRTRQQLAAQAARYDCLLCGSDQIWNLGSIDGDPVYFLDFPKQQRRVAYGPSFGSWLSQAPKEEARFLPWLQQFDALSLREADGAAYLETLGFSCQTVLDPTLLRTKTDFLPLCAPRQVEGPYVLLFSWYCGPEILSAAKSQAKALGLPLIQITPPPRAMGAGIHRMLDVGPREFLSLMRDAEYIVTDSFHGTAFSLIWEKPFQTLGQDPRIQNLLELLDIRGLPDYRQVTPRRLALAQRSRAWLAQALAPSP